MKGLLLFVMFAVVLFGSAALASEEKPSATVSIETKSVAIGIGFQWGGGVLKFEGKEHKFRLKGLSVVDLGVSSISAVGNVYHLNKLSHFEGTYSAAEAGVAIGAGVGAQTMENQYGVVMTLTSKKAGLKLKLAPEGIKVQLK